MPFAVITSPTTATTGTTRRAVREAVAAHLADPALSRLIVAPTPETPDPDAVITAVIAALMLNERLDVEVGYAAPGPTRATEIYGLPCGADGRDLAESGQAVAVPLMRDDAATVLLGQARHLGEAGAALHGESYVDDHRLFRGEAAGIEIEPTPQAPGLRARLLRRPLLGRGLRGGRWYPGRAVQTGGTNLVVEREGQLTDRVVKRSTYYRHHVDLLLVSAREQR